MPNKQKQIVLPDVAVELTLKHKGLREATTLNRSKWVA